MNSARRVSSSSGRGASKLPPLNFRLRSRTSFLVLRCSSGACGSSAAGANSCRQCPLHEPVAEVWAHDGQGFTHTSTEHVTHLRLAADSARCCSAQRTGAFGKAVAGRRGWSCGDSGTTAADVTWPTRTIAENLISAEPHPDNNMLVSATTHKNSCSHDAACSRSVALAWGRRSRGRLGRCTRARPHIVLCQQLQRGRLLAAAQRLSSLQHCRTTVRLQKRKLGHPMIMHVHMTQITRAGLLA